MSEKYTPPSPDDLARMRAMAIVLGQDYVALRNNYIVATKKIAPRSVQPTAETDLNKVCGAHHFTWELGHSTVKAYVGTAFPEDNALLHAGAHDIGKFTAEPQPAAPGAGMLARLRARYAEKSANVTSGIRKELLHQHARTASWFTQCVTVEQPKLAKIPKTLHSVTCESVESQFMLDGFRGEPEVLAEMHWRMSQVDPEAFQSPAAYDVLRDAYLPPLPMIELAPTIE
ncbi:MAG: hypothetical protein ABWX94_03635 [Candidatus Saccharimonadales bacterium]